MPCRPHHTLAALAGWAALVGASACGHDHDHDHDHDHFATTACEHAAHAGEALEAATDPEASPMPEVVAGAGPVAIALTPGERNFVRLTTVTDHADAAIFARPAGALVAFLDEETEASYSLDDAGPPSACADQVASDYRLHLHAKSSYRLELDPAVATSVWLLFVDGPSDHTPGHTH